MKQEVSLPEAISERMQIEVCACVCACWAWVRQISLHPISLRHPSARLLSPSILDDNSVLICIPKTLSDTRLPSRCERLENIDNYWRNPKAWATFHRKILNPPFYSLICSFLPPYEGTLLTRVSDCRCRGLHAGSWEVLACYGSGCCIGWEVMLLLLVCAHFPMTPTLIKIIISVAPRMALQWGLCRLSRGLCEPLGDQLFCLQANVVITVINTWHKGEDGDGGELPGLKGRGTICWDIKECHQSRSLAERRWEMGVINWIRHTLRDVSY